MTKIIWDEGFKRSYKSKIKINKRLKKKFWIAMETFEKNPFASQIRTHELSGKLKGLWAFSVDYNRRLTGVLTDFHFAPTQRAKSNLVSEGIPKETPSLGKPVLVLRQVTERPEAVEAGTVRLVGLDKDKIVREAQRLLDDEILYEKMSKAANPYGDGKASKKIVEILERS